MSRRDGAAGSGTWHDHRWRAAGRRDRLLAPYPLTGRPRYLSRLAPDAYQEHTRTLRARLENARRLAARLDEAYPLKRGWLEWPDAGTVVCRCEETRWSDIGAAVADGARDVRAVREVTRCGTGYRQARVCGPALTYALSAT